MKKYFKNNLIKVLTISKRGVSLYHQTTTAKANHSPLKLKIMKITIENLTQEAQQAINSMSQEEKFKALGSLDRLVNHNLLETNSSPDLMSEFVIANISFMRAERAADDLSLTDEQYDEKCLERDAKRLVLDRLTNEVIKNEQ